VKLLVVAPHPDDDALACGGTIARLHAGGARVRIVYVTDGSASHLGSRAFPPPRLARLRAREAHEAARALGIGTESLRFWRERDAALSGDVTAHARLVRRFARELDRFRPTVVLSPWIREPHADHAVCAHAVREALARTRHAPILYEYPVWLGRFGDADAGAPRQSEAQCVRVDVAPYRARKRAAILAHRSQRGGVVMDASFAFVLPEELIARGDDAYETFFAIAPGAYAAA